MVEVWGEIPAYKGRDRCPKQKQTSEGWQHLKVITNKGAKEPAAFCEKKWFWATLPK